MKIMQGEMLERRFAWPEGHAHVSRSECSETHRSAEEDDQMILTGEESLHCNDVAYMHGTPFCFSHKKKFKKKR